MGNAFTGAYALTTESTSAADEYGRLILEDNLARGFVLGFHDRGDSRSLSFVQNLQDPAQP